MLAKRAGEPDLLARFLQRGFHARSTVVLDKVVGQSLHSLSVFGHGNVLDHYQRRPPEAPEAEEAVLEGLTHLAAKRLRTLLRKREDETSGHRPFARLRRGAVDLEVAFIQPDGAQ